MTRSSKLPPGVKVIIGFHLCSFVLWFFGQSVAVVAYDTMADWGLQGPRDLLDPVIVEVNRGIGLTDTLVMLPLFIVAAAGLARKRFFGSRLWKSWKRRKSPLFPWCNRSKGFSCTQTYVD